MTSELVTLEYDYTLAPDVNFIWLPISFPDGGDINDFTMIINGDYEKESRLTQPLDLTNLPYLFTITIKGPTTLALSNARQVNIGNALYSDNFLTKCLSWEGVSSLHNAFCNTTKLMSFPDTLPDGVTDLSYMFSHSTIDLSVLSPLPLSKWDVSNVTDMSYMFANTNFNNTLYDWNVGSVKNMSGMFSNTPFNNESVSNWGVSNVTDMSYMFANTNFNKYLNWNVGSVTNMSGMFSDTPFNNAYVSNWNVSNVTDMSYMFANTNFNNTLNWKVGSVQKMIGMFSGTPFNRTLSNWDVSNVTDMSYMFAYTTYFDQPLDWTVTSVINMTGMFQGTKAFNQDISKWDVSNVIYMTRMFQYAKAFNQNISDLIHSNTINISNMVSYSALNIYNYDRLLEKLFEIGPTDKIEEPFGGNLLVYSTDLPKLTFHENVYSSTDYFEYNQTVGLTINNTKTGSTYNIFYDSQNLNPTYQYENSITYSFPANSIGNYKLTISNGEYSLTQQIVVHSPTVGSNPVSSANNQLNASPPNTFIALPDAFKRHFGIDGSRQVIGISLGSTLTLKEGTYYIPIIIGPRDRIIIKTQLNQVILRFINNLPYLDGKRLYENDTVPIGNYLLKVLHIGSLLFEIEYVPTSPICFPSGTPITTDQGNFPIETLTTQTIKGYPIELTKTISPDSYLVCFEKHSLAPTIPSTKTILSKNHRVDFGYHRLKAKDYIGMFEGVYKIPYHKQPLYNVLLPIHSTMKVNHMTCETLHPNHIMAKIFKKSGKEQAYILSVLERLLKQKRLNSYRSVVASL